MGALTTSKSTPHQRLYVRTLINRLELPTHQVTVMHRDLFRRCEIVWRDGVQMDPVLEALDQAQVRRLIDDLRDNLEDA